MIETAQIVDVPAQPAAVVHIICPKPAIRDVMGPRYSELMAALAAQGVTPTGPWFSHHLRMDPDVVDFEIGVPVDGPVSPAGRVVPGELRATRAARTVYHGGYERLGDAWGEFRDWIVADGHTPAADLWEFYVTGTESTNDPAELATELIQPLNDGAGPEGPAAAAAGVEPHVMTAAVRR
ncbi:MAG: GyrI-like domain-containing protein [Thermoleophilia bacterium]